MKRLLHLLCGVLGGHSWRDARLLMLGVVVQRCECCGAERVQRCLA